MVRWLRWHCPPDTGFEIRALAVWGRARYLSVTEAPHNTNFHTWMGEKQFCFFQTAETGNRTPDSGVKGSGVNHYPRAPALQGLIFTMKIIFAKIKDFGGYFVLSYLSQIAQHWWRVIWLYGQVKSAEKTIDHKTRLHEITVAGYRTI